MKIFNLLTPEYQQIIFGANLRINSQNCNSYFFKSLRYILTCPGLKSYLPKPQIYSTKAKYTLIRQLVRHNPKNISSNQKNMPNNIITGGKQIRSKK